MTIGTATEAQTDRKNTLFEEAIENAKGNEQVAGILAKRLYDVVDRLGGATPTEVSKDPQPSRPGAIGALDDVLERTCRHLSDSQDSLTRLEDLV